MEPSSVERCISQAVDRAAPVVPAVEDSVSPLRRPAEALVNKQYVLMLSYRQLV